MDITLKQLEVFVKVAQFGSVTKAAESLFLTQSATSMALSEFEKLLGEKYFDRIGKRLQLNEKGKSLLPLALENIERMNELEQIYGGKSTEPIGNICIGASSTIGNYFLPKVIGRFLHQFEKIEVKIDIANSDAIANSILKFENDIGLIEGHYPDKNLINIPWRKDHLVIVCSPKHPLAKKENLTEDDISNAKWILREKGSSSRSIFLNSLKGKVHDIDTLLELGNTEAIKQAVVTGVGIGCVSLLAAKQMLWSKDLVALKAPFLDLKRTFYLSINKEKYHTDTLKHVLHFLKQFSLLN